MKEVGRRGFTPIRTNRLIIRPFVADDAVALAERRNDPAVARYQNWTVPFSAERAEQMVADLVAMSGPVDDDWWMAVVCDAETGETLGDLALGLSWGARSAEIGYTFASRHWGRGYAVEAAGALVAYLFGDLGVTRVFGMLHPENPASAMVLERCGMLFEGHTRSSFWLGGECSDDWILGMTRSDWRAWRDRPRHRPRRLRLAEITAGNVDAVARLRTHKTQERFVAPMAASFAEALFPDVVDGAEVVPWLRAAEADGEIVGFVMLALGTGHHSEPRLRRLLVDRLHQRRGIGGLALAEIFEACRAMGHGSLVTSWGEGKGSPGPFYRQNGFEPTGRMIGGEVEGRRALDPSR